MGEVGDTFKDKFVKYRGDFDSKLPKLIDDVTVNDMKNDELSAAAKFLRKALEYNVKGGKRNRGLMVVVCLDYLKNGKLSTKDISNAVALGWCVEWLQSSCLVADDTVDQSELRRGQPCWYKRPGVGLFAINDALLLKSCAFQLLRIYFSQEGYYRYLVNCIHEVAHWTAMGQELDLLTSQNGKKIELQKFTYEKFKAIVKYKTAFYSFYLPIALAMHMAGITNGTSFEEAKQILLELGIYFQIQDDYLDCFGDPKETGKIGTDIQEGKCTWLIVKALEAANKEQRDVLETCYGMKDTESVSAVKRVYHELNLQRKFREFEEESLARVFELIQNDSNKSLPRKLFLDIINKIYKRSK